MISGFIQPMWLVAVVSVVLVIGLLATLVLEARSRKTAGRRAIVMALNVLAFVALWGLLTQPATESVTQNNATLVTAGASAADLENLDGPVYLMADSGLSLAGSTVINDVEALRRQQPALDSLTVLGHGLPAAAWGDQPVAQRIEFNPPPVPPGLVDVRWDQRTVLGRSVGIAGRYHGGDAAGWTLALEHQAGEVLAATQIQADGTFALTFQPKTAGGHVPRLVLTDAQGAERDNQPLPVWVEESSPMKVLMHLSRPNFEANAIKQFLLDGGAEVTVEVELSREIRRTEVPGDGNSGGTGLTREGLSELDLLVVNAAGLEEMGSGEVAAIEGAVADGLGVLVLVDESVVVSGVMPFAVTGDGGEVSVFEGAFGVNVVGGLEATAAEGVVRSDAGDVLVAVRGRGNGNVGVSVMGDSFGWRMSGDEGGERFGEVWGEVVERVGRVRVEGEVVRSGSGRGFVRVGEKVEVCGEVVEEMGVRECVGEWEGSEGWSENGVFVMGGESWGSDEVLGRQRGTEGVVREMAGSGDGSESVGRGVMRGVVSLWVWWGVVLMAAGGVWGCRKGWG